MTLFPFLMMLEKARKRLVGGFLALLLAAGTIGILTATATTRQGVNYKVSSKELPVYVKTVDFLHRHYQYTILSEQITRGAGSERERALAVFDWTCKHLQRTPAGWPVVDDHVLNIIIRGHGLGDQMADVFTTLLTYAGVPAFWIVVPEAGVLSFAKVEGKWRVFDVANGIAFRNTQGDLADLEEVSVYPSAEVVAMPGELHRGSRESRALSAPRLHVVAPDPLRAELQMPWPRLKYEVKRSIGW